MRWSENRAKARARIAACLEPVSLLSNCLFSMEVLTWPDSKRRPRASLQFPKLLRRSGPTRLTGPIFRRGVRRSAGVLCRRPHSTLELYIVDRLRTLKLSSVERRVAAIVSKHRDAGVPDPYDSGVKAVLSGARRELGSAVDAKTALSLMGLRAICKALPVRDEMAVRDRAIFTVCFAAGMRVSEFSRSTSPISTLFRARAWRFTFAGPRLTNAASVAWSVCFTRCASTAARCGRCNAGLNFAARRLVRFSLARV